MKPTPATVTMKASLLLLLVASVAVAQRTRPGTDVQIGESTYVFGTVQDQAIILYAIYDASTQAVRGYALWNDTESTARARLTFHVGDPIDLEAAPGTRAGSRVATRGYVMSDTADLNVASFTIGHDSIINVSARTDRTFPLPRER